MPKDNKVNKHEENKVNINKTSKVGKDKYYIQLHKGTKERRGGGRWCCGG